MFGAAVAAWARRRGAHLVRRLRLGVRYVRAALPVRLRPRRADHRGRHATPVARSRVSYTSRRRSSRSMSRWTRCITSSVIAPSLRSDSDRLPLGLEQLAPQPLVLLPSAPRRLRRRRRRSARAKRFARKRYWPRRARRCRRAPSPPRTSSSSRASAASAALMRAFASSRSAPPSSTGTFSSRTSGGSVSPCPTSVTRMTANVRKTIRSRCGQVGRQRERGGERDRAADARPRDDDGRLPRRVRVALAHAPEEQRGT